MIEPGDVLDRDQVSRVVETRHENGDRESTSPNPQFVLHRRDHASRPPVFEHCKGQVSERAAVVGNAVFDEIPPPMLLYGIEDGFRLYVGRFNEGGV